MVTDLERVREAVMAQRTPSGTVTVRAVETGLGAGNGGIQIGQDGLVVGLATNVSARSLNSKFLFVLCVLLLQQLMAKTTLTI